MKKSFFVLGMFFLTILTSPFTSFPGNDSASVYFVHGVSGKELGLDPSFPVDITLDGGCLANGVTFSHIVGPFKLAKGRYLIKIHKADPNNPGTGEVYDEKYFTFSAYENASIVGHLNKEATKGTMTKFTNDFSPIVNKKCRIIFHHTAAIKALNVSFNAATSDEHPEIKNENIEQGDKFAFEVPKKWKWNIYVALAGPGQSDFYTKLIKAKPYRATLIYAIGSKTSGTFKLLFLTTKKIK